MRQEEGQLGRFAGEGDEHEGVLGSDMAQVAMEGFSGMHIAGVYGQRVESGNEFTCNVAALTNTDDHELSTWPGCDSFNGSVEG